MPPKRRPGGTSALTERCSNQLPTVNGWKKDALVQTRSESNTSGSESIGSSVPPLPHQRTAASEQAPAPGVAHVAASPVHPAEISGYTTSLSQAVEDIDTVLADLADDAVAMSAVEAYWDEQRRTMDGSPAAGSSPLPEQASGSVTKMTKLLAETDAWLSQSATLSQSVTLPTSSPRLVATVSRASSVLSTGNDPVPQLQQDGSSVKCSPSIRRRRMLSMRTSSVEQFFITDTPTRTTSSATISSGVMTPTDADVVLAPSPKPATLATVAALCSPHSPHFCLPARSSSNLPDDGGKGRGHLERGLSSHDESWLELAKAQISADNVEAPHQLSIVEPEATATKGMEVAEVHAVLQDQLQMVVEKLAAVDELRAQAERTVEQLQTMQNTGLLGMQSLAALSLACVAYHAQQQQGAQDAIVERVSTEIQSQMQQQQQHLAATSQSQQTNALRSPPTITLIPEAAVTPSTNGDDEETTPPVSTPNSPGSESDKLALPPLSPVVELHATSSAVRSIVDASATESPEPTPGVLRNWELSANNLHDEPDEQEAEADAEAEGEEEEDSLLQNSGVVLDVSSFSCCVSESEQPMCSEADQKKALLAEHWASMQHVEASPPQRQEAEASSSTSAAGGASATPIAASVPVGGARLGARGAMLSAVAFPPTAQEPAFSWTDVASAAIAVSVGAVLLAKSKGGSGFASTWDGSVAGHLARGILQPFGAR